MSHPGEIFRVNAPLFGVCSMTMSFPHVSRRRFLQTAGAGFGYLALAGMLGAQQRRQSPLEPKEPHFPVKAKRIIFCFMEGAMSQMDTFEYKPTLQRHDQ